MAALTPTRVFSEGSANRTCLYRVLNVTSADTISVSTEFSRVVGAAALDSTRSVAYFAPSISGTTLTLTEASMANDDVYVLVWGPSA